MANGFIKLPVSGDYLRADCVTAVRIGNYLPAEERRDTPIPWRVIVDESNRRGGSLGEFRGNSHILYCASEEEAVAIREEVMRLVDEALAAWTSPRTAEDSSDA